MIFQLGNLPWALLRIRGDDEESILGMFEAHIPFMAGLMRVRQYLGEEGGGGSQQRVNVRVHVDEGDGCYMDVSGDKRVSRRLYQNLMEKILSQSI